MRRLLIGAALLWAAFSFPVQAQQCIPREMGLQILAEKYQESITHRGLDAESGVVVEVYVSERGTFSIVATGPDGLACMMLSGEGWQAATPQPKGQAS